MKINFVDLKRQYRGIKKETDQAIQKVIDNSAFILGEELRQFEKEFARFCECKYCVGTDNGSSALELGMRALGIGPKDEVITPANSFIASSSSISFTGAQPVLVDCDPKTYNIDPQKIEPAITKRTKAIMPVHLYGQPADMDSILKIAKKHKLLVVEDACQAHGARYKKRRVGSMGNVAAFSFYPGKNLGAYGDAGALVTNSKKIADRVRMMRDYGQKKKYHHVFIAWNRRLDNLQAAILLVKLKHLNQWNRLRRKHAYYYNELLKGTDVVTPAELDGVEPVYHLYVIRIKKRDKLQQFLTSKQIYTGIHYPIPIHLQMAYKDLGYRKGDFPVTEECASEVLSLPMFPELKESEIEYIVNSIKAFLKKS